MEWVTKGAAQQGTFNGNPLSSAAGLAALTQVLTRDSYDHLGKLGSMLAEGCDRAIADAGIPAHTVDLGEGLRLLPRRATHELSGLPRDAHGAVLGVLPVDGESRDLHDAGRRGAVDDLQHTEDDVQRYIDAFGEFCQALVG